MTWDLTPGSARIPGTEDLGPNTWELTWDLIHLTAEATWDLDNQNAQDTALDDKREEPKEE
jgi:hypothetical protein